MRADGIFIAVEVDDVVAGDAELALKLSDACPVDIFAQTDSGVSIVEKNLDAPCLDVFDGDAIHSRCTAVSGDGDPRSP